MSLDGKIEFRCPDCGKRMRVEPRHAGRRAKCPGCGAVLTIPGQSETAASEGRKPEVEPGETEAVAGLCVPPGRISALLAARDRAAFAGGVQAIFEMAAAGNREGVDELETLIRANSPLGDKCRFYEPGTRSFRADDIPTILVTLVAYAQSGELLARPAEVESFIRPLVLADSVTKALTGVQQAGGEREARAFELLCLHYALAEQFPLLCGGDSLIGAGPGDPSAPQEGGLSDLLDEADLEEDRKRRRERICQLLEQERVHRPSPREHLEKLRLMRQSLRDRPEQCPACGRRTWKGAAICPDCQLNFTTGSRQGRIDPSKWLLRGQSRSLDEHTDAFERLFVLERLFGNIGEQVMRTTFPRDEIEEDDD